MTTRALILGLSLFSAAAVAAPRSYSIDGNRSTAVAHVGKTGLASFAGHEHLVVAGDIQGEVAFDPQDFSRSSVDLVVSTRSLTVSEKGEPEGDAPKVQEAMRGPNVLDVARFPVLHVRSLRVTGELKSPGHYRLVIIGEVSLHGVTRSLTAPVYVDARGDTLAARGKLVFEQTEFGIEPTSAAGGLVRVENEVAISFDIAAVAPPPR